MSVEDQIKQVFEELDIDAIETWSKRDILNRIRVWRFDSKEKVLKILEDGLFIPNSIMNRDSFMIVLKSAVAHKNLVVAEHKKLRELADLVKTRPKPRYKNPNDVTTADYVGFFNENDEWFEVYEKKFVEAFGLHKKKETT